MQNIEVAKENKVLCTSLSEELNRGKRSAGHAALHPRIAERQEDTLGYSRTAIGRLALLRCRSARPRLLTTLRILTHSRW